MTRTVAFEYQDPLESIWGSVLVKLGIKLSRSSEVYAAWDGKDTLTLDDGSDFDADDNLAQLIFHEVCHLLVAGNQGRSLPDWGLDNTSAQDLVFEHACHRLQAKLAEPYGLRDFMAVTTEWRPYWEALPADPLADCADPALPLARAAYLRAQAEPFRSVLHQALSATAAIADVLRASCSPSPRWLSSLWARARARHSSGFLMSLHDHQRCGDCAWAVTRRGKLRCRQSAAGCGKLNALEPNLQPASGPGADELLNMALVNVEQQGCEHWEPVFRESDCGSCGACCHIGFDVVDVSPHSIFAKRHPELVAFQPAFESGTLESGVIDSGTVEGATVPHTAAQRGVVPRPDGRCVALEGDGKALSPYRCRHYSDRPSSCRQFEVAGEACLVARRRAGVKG